MTTLGVGDGTGNLFVHGEYEAIRKVRDMMEELWEFKKRELHKTDYEKASEEVAKDIVAELKRAKTLFPQFLSSQHEGYAVILEELDELWEEIKKNQKVYDLGNQRKEAIQCAAMLVRFIVELLPKPEPK